MPSGSTRARGRDGERRRTSSSTRRELGSLGPRDRGTRCRAFVVHAPSELRAHNLGRGFLPQRLAVGTARGALLGAPDVDVALREIRRGDARRPAVQDDTLPAELAGFDLQNVTLTPAPATVPRTITWNPGGSPTPPAQVGSDTGFTIDLQQTTDDPVGIGLGSGTTFTIALSLRVPDDYPPGTSPDIVNTATATATNANPVSDNATVNIVVATVIDVGVTKSWTPSTQLFNPGATSTIGLGVRNTSNVPVTTLTMQEPAAAPDGAATLDPSNPFTITDFTGFGTTSLPTGCDTVRVDAYVFGGSTWGWVTGTVYFTRSETRNATTVYGAIAIGATICAGFAPACGFTAAMAGVWALTADYAYSIGKCLKIKLPTLEPGTVSRGDRNCK